MGNANNNKMEAAIVQAFMLSSLFADNKDIVSLIPVRNLTAEHLHLYTLKVLELLNKCGYFVVCLISDNNLINRNMFTMMCGGGVLKQSINHPFNKSKKLFFFPF